MKEKATTPALDAMASTLDKINDAGRQIARLKDLAADYSRQEAELLRDTDPENPEIPKILGPLKLKQSLVPGKLQRWEEEQAALEQELKAGRAVAVNEFNALVFQRRDALVAEFLAKAGNYWDNRETAVNVAQQTDAALRIMCHAFPGIAWQPPAQDAQNLLDRVAAFRKQFPA